MESLGTVADARKALEEAKRMIEEAEKLLEGTRQNNAEKITEAAVVVQRVSAKTSLAGRILTVFANEARSKENAKRSRAKARVKIPTKKRVVRVQKGGIKGKVKKNSNHRKRV